MIRDLNKGLLIPALLFLAISSFGQSLDNFYLEKTKEISADSIHSNLVKYVDFGIKNPGSVNLENAGVWLEKKYKEFGYDSVYREYFVAGNDSLFNVIAIKEGVNKNKEKYFVFGSHYDSYNGPGANDNGTGVVSQLEAARILQGVPTKHTLIFIHFTGEEAGYLGSLYHVNHLSTTKKQTTALYYNIDQVGSIKDSTNSKIFCERDESSPTGANALSYEYTDTVARLVRLYSDLTPVISKAYLSDYMPFQEKEIAITGLYEETVSPYTHSINDSLSKVDLEYVRKVSMINTSAMLYFGRGKDTFVSSGNPSKETLVKFHYSPSGNYLQFDFQSSSITGRTGFLLNDINGRRIFYKEISGNGKIILPVPELPAGVYVVIANNMHFGNLPFKFSVTR